MDNLRIYNKWPIAREGLPFILLSLSLTCLFLFLNMFLPSLFFCLITLFVIFFFMDPERKCNQIPGSVISPADGKIIEIRKVKGKDNPLEQDAVKISIFMSIFNVHVNRSPVTAIIRHISYHPGKFFSANLDKASEQNERNIVCMETDAHQHIAVIQIAGLIARRIVCWIEEGDKVLQGQRFGLIRFGSRLEVFMANDSRITVQPGQKVKAGETIVGYLQ